MSPRTRPALGSRPVIRVMRSFLGAPIMVGGRVWGDLYLAEKARGPVHRADQQAAVILAGWAAIAIENARLYAVSEHRGAAGRAGHAGVGGGPRRLVAVGRPADLARALALIMARARELVGASSTVIWLRDGDDLVLARPAPNGSRRRRWAPGSRSAMRLSARCARPDDA